jgi:hypothetical protein
MKILRITFLVLISLAARSVVHASSVIPLTTSDRVGVADAIFRGMVTASSCFQDTNGLIYTRTSLRVDEPLKGIFPTTVQVIHRGGVVGNRDEFAGYSPRFQNGGEYLVFVARRSDGTLACVQGGPGAIRLQREKTSDGPAQLAPGDEALLDEVRALTMQGQLPGADVTDQVGQSGMSQNAVTGLLVDTNAISSRFLQPDRGEPIPYLIDADNLPAGITLTQATNAVSQALNAWAQVTSLKFQFAGIQSFGQGADTITTDDQKLRIQLHDNYNRINATNVFGIGGRGGLLSPLPGVGWDIGGNVAGNEFHRTSYGYVVLERTNAAMSVLSTFTEVLCHEIGHALSMAHSSEIPANNALLTNSIMYFQAHADGRGATLGAYDPPVIQQAYPSNTPPFSFDRVMDVTDASPQPNIAGINEIELRGYDLQTTHLTLIITNIDAPHGTFSQVGTKIKFTPAVVGNGSRADPAGNGYFDLLYARLSDGTNASPYLLLRVVSLSRDTSPATSDGIPDNWMNTYFGNPDPASGTKHQATDDFDGDGLSNMQEYLIGSNPTNAASGLLVTLVNTNSLSWQARPYELYEVLGSTNLSTWARVGNPVLPTNSTGTFAIPPANMSKRFFRVLKVP